MVFWEVLSYYGVFVMYGHKLACRNRRVSLLFYVFKDFSLTLGKIGLVENIFPGFMN